MTTTTQTINQRIQQAQNAYGQWLALQPALAASLETWQQAIELMKILESFYFHPEWIDLHNHADEYSIDTQGNYSVLSQDALWNASVEHHDLVQHLQKLIMPIVADNAEESKVSSDN